MMVSCIVCGEVRPGEVHFAEGWMCARCVHKASTIIGVYIIEGKKYHRHLKDRGDVVPFKKEGVK